MLGHPSNNMLKQAEQGIEAKVPAQLKDAFSKVVTAGLTIMYSPQMEQMRAQRMGDVQDPAKEAGQGAARMLSNLYEQSKRKMPVDVMVPAAMIFAFEFLDLLAQSGKAQITPDLIDKTTESVGNAVLPMFGVTPDKLQQMIAQSQTKKPAGIIAGAQGGM